MKPLTNNYRLSNKAQALRLLRPSASLRTPRGRSGQASLELAMAIILLLILFAAVLKIFVWVNATLVNRQFDYEQGAYGRVAAGGYNATIATGNISENNTQYTPLKLF